MGTYYRHVCNNKIHHQIDEIHLLNEERGNCLEALVTRMKLLIGRSVRIVSASATIPNIDDVANWLHAKAYSFGENYRSVPLEYHVESVLQRGNNSFLFENSLNNLVPSLIQKYSPRKPSLVFCNSRKSTEKLAFCLKDYLNAEFGNTKTLLPNPNEDVLKSECITVANAKLKGFL